MADKSDNVEVYRRVRQVQEWILEGHSSSDICRNCTATWGIKHRQAEHYIRKAFLNFVEETSQDDEKKKAFHIKARMKIYKHSIKYNKYDTSLNILDSLARIEGILVNKVDHTTKGKSINTDQTIVVKIGGKKLNDE